MMIKSRINLPDTTLILVMGVATSGKSTLAKSITGRYIVTLMDKDTLMDPFTVLRGGEYYSSIREPCYWTMYSIILDNLGVGNSTVLTGPFVKEVKNQDWVNWFLDTFNRFKVRVILCHANENILRKRLRNRGKERDIERLNNWRYFLNIEPIEVFIPFSHIRVDTSSGIEDIEEIYRFIEGGLDVHGDKDI